MEVIGIVQQILQIAVPQPSGRPFVVAQALRRSIVVTALAARNLRHSPIAVLTGAVAAFGLAFTLSRGLLELSGWNPEQMGRLPAILLQVIYTVAFLAIGSSLWRKFRHLL